jgi:hypothetical protein
MIAQDLMLRMEHELIRVAMTAWGEFALYAMSLPGNPSDGHLLEEELEQVERRTELIPMRCHVDRGYKSRGVVSETCGLILARGRKDLPFRLLPSTVPSLTAFGPLQSGSQVHYLQKIMIFLCAPWVLPELG